MVSSFFKNDVAPKIKELKLELPFISIIIPCRNEEKFINKCIDSILNNSYPQNKLEILIIDGMSKDRTRAIINNLILDYSFIKLLDNPAKIVPSGLNIGIRESRGEIILRMDAHCVYASEYLKKCVENLLKYEVENVGGILNTLPSNESLLARSIAYALSHPFGIGNSYFRIGSKTIKYVDTVPFGCFKKQLFEKIGYFDEELIRNQDDEFNLRIIKNGGKILLIPEIITNYHVRESLIKLWKMYYQYGFFKPLVVKKIGTVITFRQLVPSVFVLTLISLGALSFVSNSFLFTLFFTLSLYFALNFYSSISICRKKTFKLLIFLPIVFLTIHLSYGIGYVSGILNFIVLKKSNLDDKKFLFASNR